ncbi:MAG TPA: hypothetical protein G4N92_01615 [Anaerolineae bacterium]|nr:hypothetical protein [Anaerolineae bacterium]
MANAPLNNAEAELALAALHEVPLDNTFSYPLYILLTKGFFFVFGVSNFTARFWSAIFGSGFILIPVLYKKMLGRKPAIILSFCFALDPLLIAVSRQVDSRSLAVGLLFAAIGFIFLEKPTLAGIFTALSCMCGPSFWLGFFTLGVCVGVLYIIHKKRFPPEISFLSMKKSQLNKLSIVFLITIITIGSYCFLEFKALIYLSNSILQFLSGWIFQTAQNISSLLKLSILISYLPLGIILVIVGSTLFWKNKKKNSQFLFILLSVNFIVIMVYPGASVSDMVWISVPVWLISACVVGTMINKRALFSGDLIIPISIILVLLMYSWLGLLRVQSYWSMNIDFSRSIISVIGGLVLLGLIVVFCAWGWSVSQAFNGFIVGLFLFLLIFQLAMSFRTANIGKARQYEMITEADYFDGADLISITLKKLSQWNAGIEKSMDIAVANESAFPSLMWLIRDYKVTQYPNERVLKKSNADVLFTSLKIEPGFTQNYRGQSFVISSKPVWASTESEAVNLVEFMNWFFFRNGNLKKNNVILWAREELFLKASEISVD